MVRKTDVLLTVLLLVAICSFLVDDPRTYLTQEQKRQTLAINQKMKQIQQQRNRTGSSSSSKSIGSKSNSNNLTRWRRPTFRPAPRRTLSPEEVLLRQKALYTKKVLEEAGYPSFEISARRGGVLLGSFLVRNEIFLYQTKNESRRVLVAALAGMKEVDTHYTSARTRQLMLYQNYTLARKTNTTSRDVGFEKAHRHLFDVPLTGTSGKGWGLSSPFTNKWRYVETKMNSLESPPVICEIGPYSGHSTSLYQAIVGNNYNNNNNNNSNILQHYVFAQGNVTNEAMQYAAVQGVRVFTGSPCASMRAAKKSNAIPNKCNFLILTEPTDLSTFLCSLVQARSLLETGASIVIDRVDGSRIGANGDGLAMRISMSHLRDINDVLHVLIQENGLELRECMLSDVPEFSGFDICGFRYGEKMGKVSPGLMAQYVPAGMTTMSPSGGP